MVSRGRFESRGNTYVIPQEASRLIIGIIVVLVLATVGYISCPPVEGSSAGRSVQMDRVFPVGVVHESYNGLGALRDDDGRPRRLSIVPHKPSRLELGVDLLCERLNFELLSAEISQYASTLCPGSTHIIPDILLRDRIGDLTTTH